MTLKVEDLTCENVRNWAARPGVFKRPSTGEDVEFAQALCVHFGFVVGTIDGRFGPKTESCVVAAQDHRFIGVDGTVGPQTREAFLAAFEYGWKVGKPFPYPGNDSSLMILGGVHPMHGHIPSRKSKVSWFGGPDDAGDRTYGQALVPVSPSRSVTALYERHPELVDLGIFRKGLTDPLPMTTDWKGRESQAGISWCLDPLSFYLAMRWRAGFGRPKPATSRVLAVADDKLVVMAPTDWGPAQWTGRGADLSLGAMRALGLQTDQWARFTWADDGTALGVA